QPWPAEEPVRTQAPIELDRLPADEAPADEREPPVVAAQGQHYGPHGANLEGHYLRARGDRIRYLRAPTAGHGTRRDDQALAPHVGDGRRSLGVKRERPVMDAAGNDVRGPETRCDEDERQGQRRRPQPPHREHSSSAPTIELCSLDHESRGGGSAPASPRQRLRALPDVAVAGDVAGRSLGA